MRELKFRAYDKVEKEMLTILEMDWYSDRTLRYLKAIDKDGEEWYYDSPDDIKENLTIDQFTGLKDKNGKDIYENDILAWHSNVYRKHHWVGLVVYRGAGFVAQDGPKSYSSSEWLECACQKDANLVEIIGNVHEDGQLLEADK